MRYRVPTCCCGFYLVGSFFGSGIGSNSRSLVLLRGKWCAANQPGEAVSFHVFFQKIQVLLSICDACDGGCACNPHLGM